MSSGASQPSVLRFGVFELNLASGELRKGGTLIKLPPQPFRVLALIATRNGQVVTREEIQKQIWGSETFVDFEQGMNHCIKQIRTALSDSAETPRYIETLPRRGYRFIAPLEHLNPDLPPSGKSAFESGAARDLDAGVNAGVSFGPEHAWYQRQVVVVACAAFVAVAAVVALWFAKDRVLALSSRDKPSIAVLPFADMSSEKNQEYFSDGLSQELLNDLAQNPALRVAGRTSSFQFKGKAEDLHVIGRKLHVATILEGSVRRQGSRARIAVQLIKTDDGFQLWSQTFDREMNDIFAVQEEIGRAVTGALQIKLLGAKTTPPSVRSSNAEAFNAYLQGRYFLLGRRTRGTLAKAVSYFEQAVNLDPGYAQAWVGLGQARSDQAGWAYVPVEEGYRTGREAVERALRLNPNLAEAHAVLGSIRMSHDWDWAGADESFKRALALEPGNPIVVSGAGSLAWILGRLDEAIGLYRKAIEIDPLNANLYYYIGVVLHYAGRQEEAMSALNKAVELAPEMEFAHALLCRVSLAQGHLQEALAEAVKEKDPAFRLWGLALACHALGRKKESDANLAELISKFQTDDPYQIAGVYAFRGEKDEAFKWLDRARNERDPGMIEMKGDPLLKNLEQSPRYPELLAKMRLPR